jgi:hypothetical protein
MVLVETEVLFTVTCSTGQMLNFQTYTGQIVNLKHMNEVFKWIQWICIMRYTMEVKGCNN